MKPEKIERRPSSEERFEVLRDLFPEVFTDGRVALDRLKELLEDVASDGPVDEHYALNWPGKQQARRLANQPPHVTLRPVPKAGVDEETTGNMVIVGDNLQVLLLIDIRSAALAKPDSPVPPAWSALRSTALVRKALDGRPVAVSGRVRGAPRGQQGNRVHVGFGRTHAWSSGRALLEVQDGGGRRVGAVRRCSQYGYRRVRGERVVSFRGAT